MFQFILTKTKKIIKMSLSSLVILTIIPIMYSLIKKTNILKSVFDFNFFIASIIILYGLFAFFIPVSLKKSNRLVDHSNYAEVLKEEKEKKFEDAIESIFWGVSNIIIVGITEVILRTFF